MESAARLALSGAVPLDGALRLPASVAEAFFSSRAWADHVKAREARDKLAIAGVNGIGVVVKSIGNLGRGLAGMLAGR